MNCKCGHRIEDHIYHEGACRPGGIACSCEQFRAETPPIEGSPQEILYRYLEARPDILVGQIEMLRTLADDLQTMNKRKDVEIRDLRSDMGFMVNEIPDYTGDETLLAMANRIRKKWNL